MLRILTISGVPLGSLLLTCKAKTAIANGASVSRQARVLLLQDRERLHAVVLAARPSRGSPISSANGTVSLHAGATPSAVTPAQTAEGDSAPADEATLEPAPVPPEPAVELEAEGAPPQQAAPPRPPRLPDPPRMTLQEAVALVQAAERGRQARERVAALQLARRRDDARQRIRAAGTVGLSWRPSR